MNTLPKLNHSVSGALKAPWLTFIPGIGNDATFWKVQTEALANSFRILTFDPWGHGQSPAPPQDCRFQDIVQGVIQLWDALGVTRSNVVGLGFGGSVGMAIGLDHPERVERLVAFCCRPRQPDDRRDFWRTRHEAARTQGLDSLSDATVDRWLSPEFRAAHPNVDTELRAMMKRTTLEGYQAYVGAFIDMDFEARLDALHVPTLLVAAQNDHGGGPVEAMRDMVARIPGAALEVIADSGHICNYEKPELVTDLLRGYLCSPIRRVR